MQELIELFRKKISLTEIDFIRSDEEGINWNSRLICIRGSRGTGKTTLILQHIKKTFANNLENALYVSLDNLYFADNSLIALADSFSKRGGTHLFLDEVHKYPKWSQTIKNLYDDYPELSIVFTGSSLLEILNSRSDLSRRALVYELQGLSFREYLAIKEKKIFPKFSLEQILKDNEKISASIVKQTKPLKYFHEYLKTGYYPYFIKDEENYAEKLGETINMILDIELPILRNVEVAYIPKIKKLLRVIAKSAPFLPNITKIATEINVSRQTLLVYLKYLEDSKIISLLYKNTRGLSLLEKPDKIFLENANLMYMLEPKNTDIGNARETFAQNQLAKEHEVLFSEQSDFLVDKTWTFEVGGQNKKRKQIQSVANSFIFADDIEYGTQNRIPLWLLGFMY